MAKKLADWVIEEFEINEDNNILYSATTGNGSISDETFRRKYIDDYGELIESSIVVIRDLPELRKQIIHPKVPELVVNYYIPFFQDNY